MEDVELRGSPGRPHGSQNADQGCQEQERREASPRHGEDLEGRKKPDAEVKTFRDAGKLLKAA